LLRHGRRRVHIRGLRGGAVGVKSGRCGHEKWLKKSASSQPRINVESYLI
jgi:hypothetical protein